MKLLPTPSQKVQLRRFFDSARWVYNECISVFNKTITPETPNGTDFNRISMRKLVIPAYKEVKPGDPKLWLTETPYDTNELAVHEFITSLKGCQTRLKKHQIHKFMFNFREKKSKTQAFWVNDRAMKIDDKFKGITIFQTKNIGLIRVPHGSKKTLKEIGRIDSDSQIQLQNGQYFLITTLTQTKRKIAPKKDEIIALDPGVRTFLTGFTEKNAVEIGAGYSDELKIYYEEIDKYKSLLHQDCSSAKKKKLGQRILKLRTKVKNAVHNFHFQSASWLTSNYKIILLPAYKTASMVRENSGLGKPTRKAMLALSFYKFSQKIEWLASLRIDCTVIRCSEAFTTKTCGHCGKINDIGSSKDYKCACGYEADRDWNAARNIYIRSLTKQIGDVGG